MIKLLISFALNNFIIMEETVKTKRNIAHEKLEQLIEDKYYKQVELAAMMGISYRTFWDRRNNKNWTGKEVNIIMNL